MTSWYCSDYHFFHKNIISYENRPFPSVEKMNSEIIRRHNERVKIGDIVYFLGDLGFYGGKNQEERGEGMPVRAIDLLKEMNGTFIRVRGNHDKETNKTYIPTVSVNLDIGGLKSHLVHRPMDANLSADLIICGHCHGAWETVSLFDYRIKLHNLIQTKTPDQLRDYYDIKKFLTRSNNVKIDKLFINVSVENHNYYPYSWDEIKALWDRFYISHPQRKEINKCLTQSRKNK